MCTFSGTDASNSFAAKWEGCGNGFPNDTIHITPDLVEKVHGLVGQGNVEVKE
jgi:hypothetical protein